jgi:hypothetical protein
MIKGMFAPGLSLALLIVSTPGHVTGSTNVSRLTHVAALDVTAARTIFHGAQEDETPSLPLPQAKGAWVIEMSRSGGMRPRRESLSINSEGEIRVTSERIERGKRVVECTFQEKLSAEDLLKLKALVRSARGYSWPENYEDPKNRVCCDQPTTRFTLHLRRTVKSEQSFNTSWYPTSSKMRPADLTELASLSQSLWNNASGRCRN